MLGAVNSTIFYNITMFFRRLIVCISGVFTSLRSNSSSDAFGSSGNSVALGQYYSYFTMALMFICICYIIAYIIKTSFHVCD